MPPKLRRLSGSDVAAILGKLGFTIHSQRGSHIKLRRLGPRSEKQTLVVPAHKELDLGTLRAIIRQAARYISEEELLKHFYTE